MSINLGINLKRVNKIYHEGEMVTGVVAMESPNDIRHEGLILVMEGSVNLQPSTKHVGLLDTFSNSIKPITLVHTGMELASAGKIPAGVTEIPFEMPLQVRQGVTAGFPHLLETYHGVFINIMYTLKCQMKRSFLNKPLNSSCQFFVQNKPSSPPPLKPVRCEMSAASVSTPPRPPATIAPPSRPPRSRQAPPFLLYAELTSATHQIHQPITGKLRVEECSVPIKSIEMQLVRVETCGNQEGYTRDATEVQNIQVCAGDVSRRRELPLYMVLPRLFVCPTVTTHRFNIEFELNIAVVFEDDYVVTENFPILLVRCS